jgi:hypothetical protein
MKNLVFRALAVVLLGVGVVAASAEKSQVVRDGDPIPCVGRHCR